jgi:hypothetical protein
MSNNSKRWGVLRIKKLYDVETQARLLPASERVALRQEYAKPIFDDLEVWLKEQLGKISSKTPRDMRDRRTLNLRLTANLALLVVRPKTLLSRTHRMPLSVHHR